MSREAAGAAMMRPEDDPGWAAYAETILLVHGPSPHEVDLARPLGARERAVFLAAGLSGSFGLVTSDNPRGQDDDPAANADRRAAFTAALDVMGALPVRVDGLSRDRERAEVGVALAWPMARVRQLARDWNQSAIYWYDGTVMWVVGALTDTAPWRLAPR